MKRWLAIACFIVLGMSGFAGAEPPSAASRAGKNLLALRACWHFNQAWLQHADPASGLIPRNLTRDFYWNAKDAAADNYPFMVLTAWFTDQGLFSGKMAEMLATEQRLCNRIGRLPDDYDFKSGGFRTTAVDMPSIIFGASEYCKDGLLPLTEWLGASPWSVRMVGLADDIWANAAVDSPVGLLPSDSHEVAGDLMQVYARLAWMTGEASYREHAYQLAAYFLEHFPPQQAERLRLDDHGCEVVGGLSEVYALAHHQDPERAARWRPAMHALLDRVLEVGRDPQGLFYMLVDPRDGTIITEERTDNWGYNYNAFATVALVDGEERYHEAVRHALRELPSSMDYPWEGDTADGIADSLEGALNLYNRYPEPAAEGWIEHHAERLLGKQQASGVFAGWHGDGNAARTLILYALYCAQGASVSPWRADVGVGAVQQDGALHLVLTAEWPWSGTLRFDHKRHKDNLHMPVDYPRLNQIPEWFTVARDDLYEVSIGDQIVHHRGSELLQGINVEVPQDIPVTVEVRHLEAVARR